MVLLALALSAAWACEPAPDEVLAVWPSWGPHPGHGMVRVRTGGDTPSLTLVDAAGGARSLGARPLDAPEAGWWSFELPDGLPLGLTSLNVEPGPITVELSVDEGLSQAPPALGAELVEAVFSLGSTCPEDPDAVLATLHLVLPGGPSGGWIAELQEASLGPVSWMELPPERGRAEQAVVFARGELTELCPSIDLYNVGHSTEVHQELECVAVPAEYLGSEPEGGCARSGRGEAVALLVLALAQVRRRRAEETRCPT